MAFVLVAMSSALSTGALAFREARTGVLQQNQDSVIQRFRTSVDAVAAYLPMAPSRDHLQHGVNQVIAFNQFQGWRVLATYGNVRASAPSADFDKLSPELRRSVDTEPSAVFQRVSSDGRPYLVVGMPITYGSGQDLRLSGVAMYLVVSQSSEQGYVDAIVNAIEHATVVALGLAVVLAVLASNGVLRPVRALRRATGRMSEGHLGVRLAVRGSDELADLSQSFNHMAQALESSVAELRRLERQARRFVADVSHELRTPLAAMSAVTDVLDEHAALLNRDTGEALRFVVEGTNRLNRLVNDLMEISRFDAGVAELSLDDVDLIELVQHTLTTRGWQDHVTTHLARPGVLRARVDPRRIDVVIANLLGNALRHGGPPVQLALDVSEEQADKPWVVIQVTDNGPGIPEDAMPHIFERFFKADTTRVKSESSGLGLAITAENLHLHGGHINVANLAQGGASFTVKFPLHHDTAAADHTASEET